MRSSLSSSNNNSENTASTNKTNTTSKKTASNTQSKTKEATKKAEEAKQEQEKQPEQKTSTDFLSDSAYLTSGYYYGDTGSQSTNRPSVNLTRAVVDTGLRANEAMEDAGIEDYDN